MKKDVVFKGTAFADFNYWQKTNKKIFQRLVQLIEEARRTAFERKGKPEPLKHELSDYWSRRITKEDRLVYKVTEDAIQIISCNYHYK